ncbi:beta-ketoacyl synthase N-terminal-like domain-containing protein [Streptomyces niveus]|uniref:beta-ketoacyl synthase N-terminal-like domain-containing protein n=1 Tax=Streptomyces niveus TaxID=193462 RepID=UPI0036D38317
MSEGIGPVWVTGMAWSTALGTDLDAVWDALLDDASGFGDVPSPFPLRSARAAVVPGVPLSRSPWDRQRDIAGATLARALEDADVDVGDPRVLPVLGTSYGPHLEMPGATSLSRWSAAAARSAGCRAEPVTVTTACSAGSDAVLAGLGLLRAGAAEICVCGAADVLTLGKRLGHSRLGTMASGELRAFDTGRGGTLLGEGAAFLVLESAERARARGARAYGTVAGAGSSNDAASAVAPDPSGRNVVLAVRRALRDAGITAEDVAVVNAHGSGTAVNDDVEARAYTEVFANVPRPPVLFATKGALGHTLGATGAIEAVAVLKALGTGAVPPIHGLRAPLPQLGLPVPAKVPMKVGAGSGISVTLGFGGFDTCLVFQGPGGGTS